MAFTSGRLEGLKVWLISGLVVVQVLFVILIMMLMATAQRSLGESMWEFSWRGVDPRQQWRFCKTMFALLLPPPDLARRFAWFRWYYWSAFLVAIAMPWIVLIETDALTELRQLLTETRRASLHPGD